MTIMHTRTKLVILCKIIITKPIIIIIFNLGTPFPSEPKKLTTQYNGGYDRQSVQPVTGKLSCNKTALKRKTEIL